jgi:hypothetical protein
MAGLIQALFGGKTRPPEPDPLPGQGGYSMPPGPAGQDGFPGSTSQTRTFSPRNTGVAKLPQRGAPGVGTPRSRQASYRGDNQNPVAATQSPRATEQVSAPQSAIPETLQSNSAAEFFGGPALHTGTGNNTAGAHPLTPAERAGGHSMIDTTTPYSRAQSQIARGVPGSNNVRNTEAQRYKARPELSHTYKSAPRADQAQLAAGSDGGAGLGPITTEVTVQSRFVFAGGGNQTWAVQREMPYGGRGNGARGAALNGQRYYAAGQQDQFLSQRLGDYGIARQLGNKRPVSFTQPGPWTADYYDTTTDVQSGAADQSPDSIYVSPVPKRPNTAVRGR